MKGFVKCSKITNVTGRLDYISRQGLHASKGQEDVLFFHDAFKRWDELAKFEQAQPSKTTEARELIIALPNKMATLPQEKIKEQVTLLVKEIVQEQPMAFAVHWNKKKNNLHLHLMFSERKPTLSTQEPKRYRQDIWAKEDGTMAHKKEDRHHIMHKKGDVQKAKEGNIIFKPQEQIGFSEKNKIFKEKSWLNNAKTVVKTVLEKQGYEVDMYDPKSPFLAEKRQGQGVTEYTERVVAENIAIRQYNAAMTNMLKTSKILPANLLSFKKEAAAAFKKGIVTPILERINNLVEKIKLSVNTTFDGISQAIMKLEVQQYELLQPTFGTRAESREAEPDRQSLSFYSDPGERPSFDRASSSNTRAAAPGSDRLSKGKPRRKLSAAERLVASYERNKVVLRKLHEDISKRRQNPNDPDITRILDRAQQIRSEIERGLRDPQTGQPCRNQRVQRSFGDLER